MAEITITDPENDGVIEVETCTRIVKDGIEYAPKFSTEGIEIPMVVTSKIDQNLSYKVLYQRISADVLKAMLKEYLPEILREINQ